MTTTYPLSQVGDCVYQAHLSVLACFILIVSLLIVSLSSRPSFADCQGCCSYHGGVVCSNGITRCADGTPLSPTCRNKSCDACLAPPSPVNLPVIYNIIPTGFLPARTLTVNGDHFGSHQGSSFLAFANSIRAEDIIRWNNNQIKCLTPLGLQSGCLSVTTNVGTSNCVPYQAKQVLPWLMLLLSD
ncbi:IPT/TIG domain-containing protein [Thermodesulfobacteriota bacterium B35]